MKISKLFHWLYAFIMLMPVFFIGGRVLYTVFNKNAKDSYSENIEITKTQVESYNQIHENYKYTYDNSITPNGVVIVYFDLFTIYTSNSSYQSTIDEIEAKKEYFDYFQITENNSVYTLGLHSSNTNVVSTKYFAVERAIYFDFTLNSFTGNLSNIFPNLTLIEEKNINTLDNAFSYSVSQLNENPLFSWAQTSFLVAPFTYISGLFGIAASSPINTLLSYWLSISIIWLVFDLIMYVPLLVHRWLDKGVLE